MEAWTVGLPHNAGPFLTGRFTDRRLRTETPALSMGRYAVRTPSLSK